MVPSGWKQTTLDKVLTIGGGKDYKHLEKGSIPVYGSGGYMLSVSDYLYDGESVCIGRKGTIDKPMFLKGKFWTVDTLFYTHSFKDSVPYFIYQFFQTVPWRSLSEASGVPSLSKSVINKVKINLPPLLEQRKIVIILATWDKAISTTDRLIDNSKQQKKALMQQLLTGKKRLLDDSGKMFESEWEEVLLGNIVDRPICYGVLKPGDHKERGIPLLRIQDLKSSSLDIENMFKITDDLHQEFKRTILRTGDLVISIVGTLGKVLKIPKQLNGANITRAFAVIGVSTQDTDFIKHYLSSDYIQEWLLNTATGNAQKVLNVAAIKKLKIKVPSLKEQQKIASVLTSSNKEIELLEQQLADLKQEKKALMQQLLTGKRRVKLDDKEVA
ncbi:restriction endonuclease subunit S [Pseudoalteromonas sp. CR1]|uniref:restriction endonuclease subunit S n=1 Tax=Pseudoalteromonas sp. CR1 TaxID=2861964 RepID=UPI001C5D6B5C|nr:restriction endonuclease subunit S [Pseudoalteromonas sp. CR1]MBW4966255.1 restriction endonuclease subunit S [Pseudoalteromonas sp. CR1]